MPIESRIDLKGFSVVMNDDAQSGIRRVMTQVAVAGLGSLMDGQCRVIAEAGANHNNSVDRAIEMARRATEAGAWAVKYQLYKADSLSVTNSPKYWSDDIGTQTQYEAFQKSDKLNYGDYAEVAAACREFGIGFFATPFDASAVTALESMDVSLYKVASGDITHRDLLRQIAETRKPVLLSTGAATEDEIERAVEWLGADPSRVVILACTLTYPTPDIDADFSRITLFRQRFDPFLIGFSDHTLGIEGGFMTAALGGCCIEKHYTLDKSLGEVPDHTMSVDPDELKRMVQACDRASLLRGQPEIRVRESEQPARDLARRSLTTICDITAGDELTGTMLLPRRPGTGIPPFELDKVVGRRAARDIEAGSVLRWDDLN